jgi:hypothetical protein
MNRPIELPTRKLKAHIISLQKEHKLTIKWGGNRPYYNEVERKLFLPRVTSDVAYITCLHEIGHALTPALQTAGDTLTLLNKALKKSEKFVHKKNITSKELIAIRDELDSVLTTADKINNEVHTSHWTWTLEMKAWQFAYQNAIIWNKNCTEEILRGMLSYYQYDGNDKTKPTFRKYQAKYIKPIFTE